MVATDLRAAILAVCESIAADLVDLRAIVQTDRLLTDDETLQSLRLLDGMQRAARLAKDATFIQWREIGRSAASQAAGGER